MLEDLLTVAAPRYIPGIKALLATMPEPARVGGEQIDGEGSSSHR